MKTRYYVDVRGHQLIVDANNKNHAAHLAFKFLLRSGRITSRPRTTNEGWYEGVIVVAKGRSV